MVGSNGQHHLGFQVGRLILNMSCLSGPGHISVPCLGWPMGRTHGLGTGTIASRAWHGHAGMRAGACLGRAFSGRARVSLAGLAHLENFTYGVCIEH